MQRTRIQTPIVLLAIALPFLLGASRGARADSYPSPGRPITVIVPYAPGGATDTGARLMAAGLAPLLHTSVQVVNRAGAGSQVGLTQLVRSAPDGYTLSYVVVPTVVTHYFDPSRHAIYTRKDFQPIARDFVSPSVLAVRSDSSWKTLKDLVEDARAHPGRITVSDSGLMGVPNFGTLMLGYVAGVAFKPVHFEGGAPSVTALLGGQVDVLAGGTVDALPYKTTGQFRVLGVASDQPDWSMPDVPTMKSLGYDVNAVSNTGIVAPAGTPADIVATLEAAIKMVSDDPGHQAKLRSLALTPAYLDAEGYTKVWIDNEVRVKPIIAQVRPAQ
jgi:tripartite-type tricarboxylate transporter receptor subunit TctC